MIRILNKIYYTESTKLLLLQLLFAALFPVIETNVFVDMSTGFEVYSKIKNIFS